jgi:hypothetical protein
MCYGLGMFTHSNLNGGSHRTGACHAPGVALNVRAVPAVRLTEAKTINYLPRSYAEYKLLPNGPAHMGVGTAEVPVSFTLDGKTYRATRVAFGSDFKSYIALTLDGGPVLATGQRLRNLVRLPVAPWSAENLVLAFAVLAAHAVALDVRAPLHSRPSWQNAIGTISNLVPNAIRAEVNAALSAAGAPFTLAVGTVTNARVRGGSGGTVATAATSAVSTEGLSALFGAVGRDNDAKAAAAAERKAARDAANGPKS